VLMGSSDFRQTCTDARTALLKAGNHAPTESRFRNNHHQ